MTNSQNNHVLALGRFGLRFASPRVEADYRACSIEDRLPAIRARGEVGCTGMHFPVQVYAPCQLNQKP